MVVYCDSRPVVLLTKKNEHPAWMLFVLAHEMGHLALRHVEARDGSALIDERVVEDEALIADPQEIDANAYALELLTGGKKRLTLKFLMKAGDLAENAKAYGAQHHIDPGHVLNAVRNTRVKGEVPWSLGNSALRLIDHEASVSRACREALLANIKVDALSDDSFEFLERLGVLPSSD